MPTVLGLETGLYIWTLLAAAGFAALVAASEVAYLVLRIIGAAVLIVLGVRAWRAAWRQPHTPDGSETERVQTPRQHSGWATFGEGALVQLANPKAAVFMIVFYPQFVPVDPPCSRRPPRSPSGRSRWKRPFT